VKIKEQNKKLRMQGGGVAFDIGEAIPRSGLGGMFTGFFEDVFKKKGLGKSSQGLGKGVAKSKSISQDLAQRGQRPMRGVNT